MPQSTPQPRFTDLDTFEAYLRTTANSVPKQTVLPILLASAERMVERYCRRRFAPSPRLSDTYQRQVVSLLGSAASFLAPTIAGHLGVSFAGQATAPLQLPLQASALQAALGPLSTVGVGNVLCTGGPLPASPISVVWQGTLDGDQPLLEVDSSALSGGYALVTDAGYDSLPPVMRRFTTRGESSVRIPDLRAVDASPDPRVPNSGGVVLYGQRLLPTQYDLGYAGYGEGGADEAIGEGDQAEPSTEINLGYGFGPAFSVAASFSFVSPIGYVNNDLSITGRWGWLPTPIDIVDAVYTVGSRRWAERNAWFSDAYVTPEGMTLSFYKQLPAAAQAALSTYRVPNIALIGSA